MNLLANKIGIFYIDKEWAQKIYDSIIDNINPQAITKVYKTQYQYYIILTDDSVIDINPAYENQRSRRYKEIYLQDGTLYEYYKEVFFPMSFPFGKIYVISSYEDFCHPMLAINYYCKGE